MSPILLERFDKVVGNITVDVLIAFCSTAELDGRALADEVDEEIARALVPDELTIIVRASAFEKAVDTIKTSTQGMAVIERVAARCRVVILGYDLAGIETDREVLVEGGLASGVGLDEILRRGATSIFHRRGGFIEASKSYHFANPSGAHTDRFIRLSNILVRQAEIAFIAVALMRRLPPDARQAYIDTPALYAVVSAVNEQWRTLRNDGAILVADNFSSYFGFSEHRFTDVTRSVAIISASSSGSLGRKLVARKGFDPRRIVHVLYLGPKESGPGVAVDLGIDSELNPLGFSTERRTFYADDCALCREASTPISLKGDQFDIAGPQHPPLVIVRKDAPNKLATTMARLAGTDALRISLGPRQFDVEPSALFKAKGYLDRLDYLLRRQVPAGIEAVVAVDPRARHLLDRAAAVIGPLPAAIDKADVSKMGDGKPEPYSGAILVVASVIGSGRLLLDVSRDLRNVAPKAPIIYLVGFAKVQDLAQSAILNRSLVQTDNSVVHVVEYAEELLLPANSFPNAWQDELSFFERNRSRCSPAAAGLIDDRICRLREASRPLTDGIFLPDSENKNLPLREGFVFWPSALPKSAHSQADVFYTIASVLQQLRTAGPAAGSQAIRTNWMQQTILSPENFGRFNDGIIQASLLRASRPSELDYRDDAAASADAARMIRRIVESAARPRGEAASEFLLALGTGRLKLCSKDADEVLEDLPGAPTLVEALIAMCKSEMQREAAPIAKRRRANRKATGKG